MTEHEDASLLAGAYALNALSPSDREAYQRYLAESSDARDEASQLADTAAALAETSTPVAPSPALRSSLLAAIATTPQLPAQKREPIQKPEATPERQAAQASESTPQPATAQASRPQSVPSASRSQPAATAAERRASARWFVKPLTAVAAAAALVFALVGANSIAAALNNGNGTVEALTLAQIKAQPDAQQQSVDLGTDASATLVWSGKLATSVLVVDGLEQLSESQTYELWYIDEDGPVSAGVFNTAQRGDSWQVLEGSMVAGASVGVTIEPAGGSEQPTTPPIIVIPTA